MPIIPIISGAISIATLTSGFLPTTIAYENESNVFTTKQKFNSSIDMKLVSGTILNPLSGYVSLYCRKIDNSNYGLFCRTLQSGGFQEVRIV